MGGGKHGRKWATSSTRKGVGRGRQREVKANGIKGRQAMQVRHKAWGSGAVAWDKGRSEKASHV